MCIQITQKTHILYNHLFYFIQKPIEVVFLTTKCSQASNIFRVHFKYPLHKTTDIYIIIYDFVYRYVWCVWLHMAVCLCVCVWVYVCVCICAHIHACAHIYMSAIMHLSVSTFCHHTGSLWWLSHYEHLSVFCLPAHLYTRLKWSGSNFELAQIHRHAVKLGKNYLTRGYI